MDRADDESCEQRPEGGGNRDVGCWKLASLLLLDGSVQVTGPLPLPRPCLHIYPLKGHCCYGGLFFFFLPASSTLSWKNTNEEPTSRLAAAALQEVLARTPGAPA